MKAISTSILLIIMVSTQGMAAFTDSTNPGKKSEISNPSNPSMVTIQQLQDENNQLKAKLEAVENKFEDQRGLFNYTFTMMKMVTKLDETKHEEKIENLQSQIGYNQMMTNTLLLLKEESGK